jgi:hypothetical protein
MIYDEIQLREVCETADLITQKEYPNTTLRPILGAGKIRNAKVAFVFINPTHRNISSAPAWEGLRAPWLGVRNVWKMFFESGVITSEVYEATQVPENWNEEFALDHYRTLAKNGFYITNLVKWTGSDAALPSIKMVSAYRELLKEELKLVSPAYTVAFGQLTFNTLIPDVRRMRFSELVEGSDLKAYSSDEFKNVVPSYFPVGQGIKNWKKAVKTVSEVLKLASIA